MQIRRNKPMPPSPLILQRVKDGLEKSYLNGKKEVQLVIPWDEFVFSTRRDKNGVYQTYLPPNFKKGVDALRKISPAGVKLTVKQAKSGEGHFSSSDFELVAPRRDPSIIEHEVTHFIQYVGDTVLNVGLGNWKPADAFKYETRFEGAKQRYGIKKVEGQKMVLPSALTLYGLGKKRDAPSFESQAQARRLYGQRRRIDLHGMLNVEYKPNVTTVGNGTIEVLLSAYRQRQEIPTLQTVMNVASNLSSDRMAWMQPRQHIAFLKDVYRYVRDNIQKHIPVDLPLNLPKSALPASLRMFSGAEVRERRRASRARWFKLQQTAPRPSPRRRAAPRPAPAPRPAAAARPRPRPTPRPAPAPAPAPAPTPTPTPARRAPAPRVSGVSYRHEVSPLAGGRMAFVIYEGGKPNGKYFFSAEKAELYVAKMSR